MRPIEFRAWDKYKKEMIGLNPFSDKFNLIIMLPNLIQIHEKSPEQSFIKEDYLNERFELMQFTGLLDKNGKKIWEGDIVRSELRPQWLDSTYIVRWDEKEATFTVQNKDVCKVYVEVIGNLYENPELVQEEK